MKNKFYIVTDIETHEKSDQIEWEILNCLGIWGIEGRNEADREVKLWEKVEEYLGAVSYTHLTLPTSAIV